MLCTRENLNTDFAAGGIHRKDFARILPIAVLASLFAGCSATSGSGAYWKATDLETYLPEDAPFSLQCSSPFELIFMYHGINTQSEKSRREMLSEKHQREMHSRSYSRKIIDEWLIRLHYERKEEALVRAKDGRESLWKVKWAKPFYGGNQITKLLFSATDSSYRMELEVNTEYEGHIPLFRLTHSVGDGVGKYGAGQRISEEFFCMRISDIEIELRANP